MLIRRSLRTAAALVLALICITSAARADPNPEGASKRLRLGLVLSENIDERYRNDRELQKNVLVAATAAFVGANRFEMAERAKMDKVFQEKSLQEFLDNGPGSFSDIVGVDFIGIIDYMREESDYEDGDGFQYFIDVRMVDTRTGLIVGTISSERSGLGEGGAPSVRTAGDSLRQNVRKAFPPMGYVIQLAGREIVIDLGQSAGVRRGDVLEVVRQGDQIIHPVTGMPLPAIEEVVAKLKVHDAGEAISRCKVQGWHKKGAESADVSVGDLVRFQGEGLGIESILDRGEDAMDNADRAKKLFGRARKFMGKLGVN